MATYVGPWIDLSAYGAVRVREEGDGLVALEFIGGRGGRATPAAARELALALQAAAERIDPRPPPRDRADRPTRGRRQ